MTPEQRLDYQLISADRQAQIDQLAAAGEWPDEVKLSEESRRDYVED